MMVKMEKNNKIELMSNRQINRFLIFVFIILVIIGIVIFLKVIENQEQDKTQKCIRIAEEQFRWLPIRVLKQNDDIECSFFGDVCTCKLFYKFNLE